MDTDRSVTSTVPASSTFSEALASIEAEIAALDPTTLEAVNVDIPTAVTTALGVRAELLAYKAPLASRFDDDIASLVDRLDVYARATQQAHAVYLAPSHAGPDVQALSKRCVELRAMLVADATSLIHRKVLRADALSGLLGPVGFRNQVSDLLQLVVIFRDHWDAAKQLSPVTMQDLLDAEAAAQTLQRAVGEREQAPTMASAAGQTRQAAFTLFVRCYEELRRAMSYLRWHEEDVDTIAPSLRAKRGTRKKDAEPAPAPSPGPVPAPIDPDMPLRPGQPPPFIDDPTS